ncbi:MAG: ABC transporter substrate-binding protein [Litorilinea sp.]
MLLHKRIVLASLMLVVSLIIGACAQPAAPAAPAAESGSEAAETDAAETDSGEATDSGVVLIGATADRPWINQCEGEPVAGGTLTLAWADLALQGRTWLARGGTTEFFVFSQLVGLSIEDAETIVPDVATAWEISEDGLTYTFQLRDDVVWHDGEMLTAEDVVWTFNLVSHPDSGATARTVLPMSAIAGYAEQAAGESDTLSGVVAVDDYTVAVTLTEPRADFLYGMGGLNLFPAHPYEGMTVAEIAESSLVREDIVGSGPFKMVEYEPDQYYILEAHEEYYKGRALLDRLIFRIGLTSVASWFPGLETNEIQVGDMVNGLDRERAEGDENLIVVGAPLPGAMSIWPNHNNFPDKRVLQALVHAVDREAITLGVFGEGQALPYDYANIDPNNTWIAPDVANFEYDPELAVQLLEEAGWDFDQELNFITYYQTELDRNVTAAMQQYWAEVGLNVNVEHMDAATWGSRVYQEPDYDLAYGCCGISVPFEYLRYSCANVPPAGLNASAYCNAEVDELASAAMVEADEATRQEMWHTISRISIEEVLHMTMFQQDRRHAVNENVCNYQFRQWSNITWPQRDTHTWWLANN